MSARRCLDCPRLVARGSRCPDCERRHRLGWTWSVKRDAWLADYPRCTRCGAPATEVDHIRPRASGGGDEGNLQSLCHRCHAAKTTADLRA